MSSQPAVSLVAMPGRRSTTLEIAADIERRGFAGIFSPSMGDVLALCGSLAHVTHEIPFGSSIEPIYIRRPADLASTAGYLHEVSGGRFRLGLGVSHGPAHQRLGVTPGKPLSDMRDYVGEIRATERVGDLPPIVLATLRDKMLQLACEIGDGAVWANAARSHMKAQLANVPDEKRPTFFVGNMIPTVIDDDRAAAAAVNRKTLGGYVALPNYRNYWKAAGYVEEREAMERAIGAKEFERVPGLMTEEWLWDVPLYGGASGVGDGVDAWLDAGVTTP